MATTAGATFQYMTRTPDGQRSSNTVVPSTSSMPPVQYYEQTYTTTGAQEWIFLPDAGTVGVTLSGAGAWVATIEATDSPPDVVLSGGAVAIGWPQGVQTATNAGSALTGATAVRANVTTVGTNVKITVRA